MEYTAEQVLRLAKRWQNPKRTYLLVNPLQGKHIPASPSASWAMMDALGLRLASRYPDAKLVIGFAETATAVAAVAASRLGEDCVYLPTTREDLPGVEDWLFFQEEHSHATEQKLCAAGLDGWLESSPRLLIIDDEISTGKTLRNLIRALGERCPRLADRQIVTASLLNRLSPEDEALLSQAGAVSECLVKLPPANYPAAVAGYDIAPAEDLRGAPFPEPEAVRVSARVPDPRAGTGLHSYLRSCRRLAEEVLSAVRLPREGRILVLGTEECMLPALVLARALEAGGRFVVWQSTTRSPIGICTQPGYPVTAGCRVRSFYSPDRDTFLYNLDRYDAALLLTDAPCPEGPALGDVSAALARQGCRRLLYIKEG